MISRILPRDTQSSFYAGIEISIETLFSSAVAFRKIKRNLEVSTAPRCLCIYVQTMTDRFTGQLHGR